ncbi:sensor histidine kinase [Salana multivorans]
MTARPTQDHLAALTGVRSGKPTYYRAYVRSADRLSRAVSALRSVSAAVSAHAGLDEVLREILLAGADLLEAPWLALAQRGVRESELPGLLLVGEEDEGRQALRVGSWQTYAPLRAGTVNLGEVRGPVGIETSEDDRAVLDILADQAVIAIRRWQHLQQLQVARQRELLENERARISRELHDSVAQHVLSAGMQIELARGAAGVPGAGEDLSASLTSARDSCSTAVRQLRRSIFALGRTARDSWSPLPEVLAELVGHQQLDVALRVEGTPSDLPPEAVHELTTAVGEALFNLSRHARASHGEVRVRYQPDLLELRVDDDGGGDPRALRRALVAARSRTDGAHQGLANISARLAALGGRVSFRRSRLGGVSVRMPVPLPVSSPGPSGGEQ